VRERHYEQYRQQGHRHQQEGFAWPARTAVDVENMARDAFARIDEIHDNNNNANDEAGMDAAFAEVEAQFNEANLEHMIRESTETVYEGSSQNRLQCAIVLFSLCTLYSVPHTFLDALLTWIAGDLLPTSNKFPRTAYEVKSLLMRLGLKHDQIHCCPDGHVLYEGDNAELDECPTCHQQRYIPGSNNVPQRVARYFDVIKHLQRMFKCPEVAKHMTWYNSHRSNGHTMRSVADSEQWKAIDRNEPEFARVLTNLRLGLVGDGIIPYKNNAIKHSTWVLLITIYNLPPWLLTKAFFISLALLIPGPKSPTADNIDVFLAPIVRDLLKLWHGVPAINMSMPEGSRRFTLRGMLIWTVNDFPAYGLLSGQQVHGYKGCPLCGPETCAEHAQLLNKMIFLGGRRFLCAEHRFRRAKAAFNNHQEWHMAPDRPTGEEVLRWGTERADFIAEGGAENSNEDPVKLHGVKRRSILFDLPYWKVSTDPQVQCLNYELFSMCNKAENSGYENIHVSS
jgi:hypothetical protein